MNERIRVTLLCGGVGGAKLALGLSRILTPEDLTIIVNTADDFEHLSLSISPDIDTVIYTLAGLSNPVRGWGRDDETWQCMTALTRLGGDTWFRLGDKDLATHLRRTALLKAGMTLTEVTALLSSKVGIRARIIPMTDDQVSTQLDTDRGSLSFQHYFVREQCVPQIRSIRFQGIENARPTLEVLKAISDKCDAIIIAPSNPFLSIDPILYLPGIRDALRSRAMPVVSVSPVSGQRAFKGPTAKVMQELGVPVSAAEIARHYQDIIDLIVIDHGDESQAEEIAGFGLVTKCASIEMIDTASKERLARTTLDAARACAKRLS